MLKTKQLIEEDELRAGVWTLNTGNLQPVKRKVEEKDKVLEKQGKYKI